jgi:hypothetical protein
MPRINSCFVAALIADKNNYKYREIILGALFVHVNFDICVILSLKIPT